MLALRTIARVSLAALAMFTLSSCAEDPKDPNTGVKVINEHVVTWDEARAVSEHEILFTLTEHSAHCVEIRHVQEEARGTVKIALIAGDRSPRPESCANDIKTGRTYRVTTVQPAQGLTIEAMDPSTVVLNNS